MIGALLIALAIVLQHPVARLVDYVIYRRATRSAILVSQVPDEIKGQMEQMDKNQARLEEMFELAAKVLRRQAGGEEWQGPDVQ